MEREPSLTKELLSGSYGLAQKVYTRAQKGLSANSAGLVNREWGEMFTGSNSARKSTQSYGIYGNSNLYGFYDYYPRGQMIDRFV